MEKSLKLLEDTIELYIRDLKIVNDFLNKTQIAKSIKENIDKSMYVKLSFNQRQQRRNAKTSSRIQNILMKD